MDVGPMCPWMARHRQEILLCIARGMNDSEVHRETGHGRNLIHQIRTEMLSGRNVFEARARMGRPKKNSDRARRRIWDITLADARISDRQIAEALNDGAETYSHEWVRRQRHEMNFRFLPPTGTFPLTEKQKEDRLAFARHHVEQNTDWSSCIFVDETCMWVNNNHRWLWRQRGDTSPSVKCFRKKFPAKIMMFGGISRRWKTPLVSIRRTVNSRSYCTDCIGRTGLVQGMNAAYGAENWCLVQDGATCHTSLETRRFLDRKHVTVLANWPSGSPDLNPIENLWAIIKRRIEAFGPQTLEELVQIAFDVWNELPPIEIEHLIDSVNERLHAVIRANGEHIKY